jgi:hypothetical protein
MLDFQLGTAIALAYDENSMLGVQVDGHGMNPGVHGRYVVGMYGLVGRPLDATDEGGALCLYADEGSEGFAWCGFDHRDLSKVPAMSGGSWCLCNSRGSFVLQDYESESTTIYVPIEDGAKAHKILVGNDGAGKPTIDILHSSGACITMTDTEVLIRHTGNGFVQIKGDDVIINGTAKIVSGLDVGGGVSIPFTLATPLATYLTALEALLKALAGSIDGKTPAPAAPPIPALPLVETFNAAAAVLKTAMVAQFSKGL